MDTTDGAEKVHNVPVPERYLPLVYEVLAGAYRKEGSSEVRGGATRKVPRMYGTPGEWTEDEVVSLYRESSLAQRAVFDYLAEHPDQEVPARELARTVYPDLDPEEAEGKLYGVLGSFGRKVAEYGKSEWFFHAHRERLANGGLGRFVYMMPAEQAAWVRKASGRPNPK